MALTKCLDCGHDVSTSAAACPNCGAPVKAVGPPPLPAVPPPPPVKSKRKVLWAVLIAACCLLLVLILFAIIGSHSETPRPSKLQGAITAALQGELSENKQKLYEKIHLAGEFGTAKSDIIQGVSMQWKDGRATDNVADLSGFTVDHTLYWKTPLTADGHTTFRDTYDCSSGSPRLTDSRITDTNGITVEGASNALINYATQEATKAIHDALNTTPAPSSPH